MDGIWLVMQYLAVPALVLWFTMCLTYSEGASQLSPDGETIITMLGYIVSLYLIVNRSLKKGVSLRWSAGLMENSLHKQTLAYLFAAGLVLAVAVSSLLGILSQAVLDDYYIATYGSLQKNQLMLSLFSIMVFAPINEELFFRGFLLNRMGKGMGKPLALIVSSCIFALLHVNPIWMVYALVMGLLLGSVRLIFQELSASIVLHAGFNFSVLISLALPPDSTAGRFIFGNRLLLAVYTAAGVAAAVYLLRKAVRTESQDAEITPRKDGS